MFANDPNSESYEKTEERWWEVNDRCRFPARIRERAWRSDMDWVPEGLYKDELLLKEGSARMLDSYLDSVPPLTLMEDLQEVGLVDSVLAGYLRRAIDRGGVEDAETVFSWASTVRQLPRNSERREKQRLLAQELVAMKAMSAANAEKLRYHVDAYDEHDDADIAVACYRSFQMDTALFLGNDMIGFYRSLYAGANSLLGRFIPDELYLRIDTILEVRNEAVEGKVRRRIVETYRRSETGNTTKVLPVTDDDIELVNAMYLRAHFSFTAGGRHYADSITESAWVDRGRIHVRLEPHRLIACVNKALCDQGSGERIWALEDYWLIPCEELHVRNWVLLPVTEQMAIAWNSMEGRPLNTTNIDRLSFPLHFCTDEIQRGFDDLQAAGVLAHLTRTQIDSSLVVANMTLHGSWVEVFRSLPDLLVDQWSLDDVDIRDQRAELIPRLVNASHGAFSPKKIKEDWKELGPFRRVLTSVTFTVGGKRYRGGGGPVAIMAMINRALGASGAPGRWYSMEEPYRRSFIFLTRDQYDALRDTYVGDYLQRWE